MPLKKKIEAFTICTAIALPLRETISNSLLCELKTTAERQIIDFGMQPHNGQVKIIMNRFIELFTLKVKCAKSKLFACKKKWLCSSYPNLLEHVEKNFAE